MWTQEKKYVGENHRFHPSIYSFQVKLLSSKELKKPMSVNEKALTVSCGDKSPIKCGDERARCGELSI